MENQFNQELEQKSVTIDKNGIEQLMELRKWSMFLSIVGFVFMGLATIIMLVALSTSGLMRSGFNSLTIIPTLILICVYFFPIYYLYKFSSISKEALTVRGIYTLTDAFDYLKRHYKFMGIMTIVVLSIYAIFLLFAVLGGFAATGLIP